MSLRAWPGFLSAVVHVQKKKVLDLKDQPLLWEPSKEVRWGAA